MTDLAGSLVTSCRPPGRLQNTPDDRTWNAGVAVQTADGSRRTADAGDEQCLRCGCSSPSCTVVRCYLPPGRCWRRAVSDMWMQQSVMYCGALWCWAPFSCLGDLDRKNFGLIISAPRERMVCFKDWATVVLLLHCESKKKQDTKLLPITLPNINRF